MNSNIDFVERQAFKLLKSYSFSQLLQNDDDSKYSFTQMVTYKSFDFNIREIFNFSIKQNEFPLHYRLNDIKSLLKYKHFDEI